jgi:hypothetical protein
MSDATQAVPSTISATDLASKNKRLSKKKRTGYRDIHPPLASHSLNEKSEEQRAKSEELQ